MEVSELKTRICTKKKKSVASLLQTASGSFLKWQDQRPNFLFFI